MPKPRFEEIVERIERYAENQKLGVKPEIDYSQELADQVRELRQQLELSVEEFADRYAIPVADIRIAELSRGVEDLKMRLLVAMIKSDPKRVADIVARVRESRKND